MDPGRSQSRKRSRRPRDAFGADRAPPSITGGEPALSAEAHAASEIAPAGSAPAARSDSEALPRAFAALREGRDADVLAILDEVPMEAVGDVGRRHAYRAQALDRLGRLEEAVKASAAALAAARKAGDGDAVGVLLPLHQRILASLGASRTADAARAADAPLADTPDDVLLVSEDSAALLIRKSHALADRGRGTEALAAARLAFREARQDRERVLALLCEARVRPDAALVLLARAHDLAGDDMNLVAAVARGARAAGVRLPPPEFG